MKHDDLDIEIDPGLDGADTHDADNPEDVDAVRARRVPQPRKQGRRGAVGRQPRKRQSSPRADSQ